MSRSKTPYKKIGSDQTFYSRHSEFGETLSASVNLEDIIEDYDGTSRTSRSTLASFQPNQQLTQSYFSVYETLKEDETTSFYSALQDGFSTEDLQFLSEPTSHKGEKTFFWQSDDIGERDMMLPKSNFQVFWHDLAYQIKPKINLSSVWHEFEQATKSRMSSIHETLNCHRSGNLDINVSESSTNSKEPLKIIQHISGSFKSGELTAVMGPSGAGKTTLLNFLSRRQEEGYSGSLYVDNSYRRIKISTIPQHDHLPEYLTVRENLLFASRLKNPQKNYDHARNAETVSHLLGLEECLDTRTKKISGGQHKRLAIAQELLSRPDILILDEPTSGLDSLTCYKTLAVLKDLVKSSMQKLIDPIAIVLTIHQPQQDVFEIFDKIYVLANGGRAIYDGPPQKCTEFIEKYAGIKIQDEFYNPGSFVIEIASGEHGDEPIKALETQVKLEFENNKRELTHRMALKSSALEAEEQNRPDQTKNNWRTCLEDKTNNQLPKENGSRYKSFLYIDQRIAQGHTINQGSFFKKTYILTERYWISLIRDPKQLIARIVFHIILPITMAWLMGTEPGQANACPRFKTQYHLNELVKNDDIVNEDIQEELILTLDNISLLFVMVYSLVSANTMAVTLSFTLDMQSSLKEYYNGWYSMYSYLNARLIAEIPAGILLPILTLAIGYPLTGQVVGSNVSITYRILITAFGIVLASMIAQTVGMIFGAIYVGHVTTALFASQGATLPMVFLSGFVVRSKNMAKFVYALSYLSYFKHSLDLTILARYGYNLCNCNPLEIGKEIELLGVSDKLRTFTEYWLNSMSEEDTDVEEVMNSTATTVASVNSTTDTDDIFKMFAKQVSLYNTYGVEIKSCQDYVPHQLVELSIDESHLYSASLALTLSLIATLLMLFLTVKLVIHFRKSL